jgi:peptide/nickel transport system permease protein
MAAVIARRIGLMAATMFVVSALVFLLLEYDVQNVAVKVLGPYSTQQQREIWLEANGYNLPALTRYLNWLGAIAQGDFGDSLRFRRPVAEVLWPRLANTALLGALTLAAVSVLGLGLGVLAGVNEGRPLDRIVSVTAVVTTSAPEFATAVILSSVFVFWLGWLPGTSGMAAGFDPWQLVLPVMVLVLYDFGYIARLTRASMAEVMRTNYIRTARLKGLSRWHVVTRHALRNALIAPYTVIVLQINWLLSGVIVVEFFFAYKGFGALLLEASLHQDLYLIQACALVAVFVAVASQALSDIGYVLLNPRLRVA